MHDGVNPLSSLIEWILSFHRPVQRSEGISVTCDRRGVESFRCPFPHRLALEVNQKHEQVCNYDDDPQHHRWHSVACARVPWHNGVADAKRSQILDAIEYDHDAVHPGLVDVEEIREGNTKSRDATKTHYVAVSGDRRVQRIKTQLTERGAKKGPKPVTLMLSASTKENDPTRSENSRHNQERQSSLRRGLTTFFSRQSDEKSIC